MDHYEIRTLRGAYQWGIEDIKILVGANPMQRYAIMQSILYATQTRRCDEFLADQGEKSVGLWINGDPLVPRDCICTVITPYFDFTEAMKMTSRSPLMHCAQLALDEVMYRDDYATLSTVYESVMQDIINEYLSITEGDTAIHFDFAPMTPRLLIKQLSATLTKEEKGISQQLLSLHESIALQCALVRKIAQSTQKLIILLYDGPVDATILASIRDAAQRKGCSAVINAQNTHRAEDMRDYAIIGREQCIDCADEMAVDYHIVMEMTRHGSAHDALQDLVEYIAGKRIKRIAYLDNIF